MGKYGSDKMDEEGDRLKEEKKSRNMKQKQVAVTAAAGELGTLMSQDIPVQEALDPTNLQI